MSGNELLAVIENMEKERGISRDILVQMVEEALMSASRKSMGPVSDLRIEVDRDTLKIRSFAKVKVVERVESRQTEISVPQARKTHPNANPGDVIEIEVTPRNFGRIAAQTAKQAIVQKIRQVERQIVVKEYQERLGDIVSGTVSRIDRGDVIVDMGRVEAIMPACERVQTEEYQHGDRIRAYLLSVQDHKSGYHLVLSRSHPNFVKRLFELEISEIADGTVEIKGIAREAGYRTKIAVVSHDENVDAVGACVGMRGARVKNIIKELMGEKIDIVRWHQDIKTYVTNALAPAKLTRVSVDESGRSVTVIADADQLSLAIGKRGQNARLTSKLLGLKIDIQKDKEDSSFEEKVAMAIDALARVEGIGRENAEKLVHSGFLNIEGILDADPADLEETAGIDSETAKAIQKRAAAARNSAAPDQSA